MLSASYPYPLLPCIYDEPPASQESDQRHLEFPSQPYRQTRWRGNRSQQWYSRHQTLLHDFKSAPSADQHQPVAQIVFVVQQCPAHQLVHGVVASHVLAHLDQLSLIVKQRRAMQSTSTAEDGLAFPQALWNFA